MFGAAELSEMLRLGERREFVRIPIICCGRGVPDPVGSESFFASCVVEPLSATRRPVVAR